MGGRRGGVGDGGEAKAPQVNTGGPELSIDDPDHTTTPKGHLIQVKGRIPGR